jgi:choline transport protein
LGLPINAFAFIYLSFAIIFCFLTVTVPVATLSDANWAPVVWIGVGLLSFGIYIVHGRKKFTAPMNFVGEEAGWTGVAGDG